MESLKGKTILVTGASGGIGSEICRQIAAREGRVLAVGRSAERLKTALPSQEGIHSIPFSVTDFDLHERFCSELPVLDGVVHSAGEAQAYAARSLRRTQLESILNVNLSAPILLTLELLRKRRFARPATTVFISSIAGIRPRVGQLAYAVSKAGLIAAVKNLTAELTAEHKISFHCVAPGLVKTKMLDYTARMLGEERMRKVEQTYPLGFGQPEAIADFICFLLSPRAPWSSGSTFILDGGSLCVEA